MVVTHRLLPWPLALLVASILSLRAHAADDGAIERWSVALSSPESRVLETGPCPAIMPTMPSALNVYVANLTDAPLSASELTFSISVDGHPYCTAIHPLSQALLIALHSIRSIGIGFGELQCRDDRGRTIPREDVFTVLERSKWSVTASIVDGAGVFTSNPLQFPFSRDQCQEVIACPM
jgi:hypothetical protein